MDFKRVGVIGSGTMGNGIAHVFAQHGFEVMLMDIDQSFLDRAMASITRNLERQVKKELINEDEKEATLSRILGTTALNELSSCEFVVEAATENRQIKFQLFKINRRLAKQSTAKNGLSRSNFSNDDREFSLMDFR